MLMLLIPILATALNEISSNYLLVDVEAAIVVAFDEKQQHCFAGNDPHPGCLLAPLQSTASPPTITVTTITITITIILTVTITLTTNVPVTTITVP